MLALERSDHGFSGESRGGHARRERLPQAGLCGSHRRWATRHSLSGRTQGATARHVTTPTPERYFSIEWPEHLLSFRSTSKQETILANWSTESAETIQEI